MEQERTATVHSFTDAGPLNGHAVGIILKELVRRAMFAARSRLWEFEVRSKGLKASGSEDFVTSIDTAAQEVIIRSLRECFPHIGIVAEEEGIRVPPASGYENCFFTVDPVDGTAALTRKQSHGIGTMLAFVWHGRIVSAWVGDIMSQEVYGFRPGSTTVHRIRDWVGSEELIIDPTRTLAEQYVLLRENPLEFEDSLRSVVDRFKSVDVEGGSIGLSMARLWKGEVGGVLLMPNTDKPWDILPVLGISEALGFTFLKVTPRGLAVTHPLVMDSEYVRRLPHLVVHRSRLSELGATDA